MGKAFVSVVLVLLAMLLAVSPGWAVDIGAPPPDIQLVELDGNPFRLSDHKGELIILKLATTWCPTCQQQSGEFQEGAEYLKENNVRIVEVFLQDSEKMVREYLGREQLALTRNVMIDDGQVLRAYNVYLIPRVILIGRDFRVLRDGNILTAQQIKAEFEKVPVSSPSGEGR